MLPRVLRPDSSQFPGSSHGPIVVSAGICMVITSSKCKDQPSKIVNSARGQLNRKKILDSFGLDFLYLYYRVFMLGTV